jgi:hypothetical protein
MTHGNGQSAPVTSATRARIRSSPSRQVLAYIGRSPIMKLQRFKQLWRGGNEPGVPFGFRFRHVVGKLDAKSIIVFSGRA